MEVHEDEPSHEKKKHIWNAKVSRYLAYCVDGGVLCSQFTLRTFVKMIESVRDAEDASKLREELRYLLHIRKKGEPFDED